MAFGKYHGDTEYERKTAFQAQLDEKKEKRKSKEEGKAIVVFRFDGDMKARGHEALASVVDEIEVNKEKVSEVVACISSPGGMVAPYGHATSELERVRELGIPLTVCIDTVAASGGYLMSLPSTKIVAVPFCNCRVCWGSGFCS